MKLVLVLVLAALVVASLAVPNVELQLEVTSSNDFRLQATLKIINMLDGGLFLLGWNTPFDKVSPATGFNIQRDFNPVVYKGIIARRLAPTSVDYIHLKGKQEITIALPLEEYFDVSQAGDYRIQFNAFIADEFEGDVFPSEGRSPDDFTSEMTDSNIFEISLSTSVPSDNNTKPGPLVHSYRNCAGGQQSTVARSWSNYGVMASAMLAGLGNAQTNPIYRTWFGTYNAARFSTVSKIVNNEVRDSRTGNYLFDCRGPQCSSGVIAYVYPNDNSAIYLCATFFQLPPTGPLSQADTIVHEVSHFNVIGGTNDYTYGEASCKSLAINNPARAVMNADNYAFYAGYA